MLSNPICYFEPLIFYWKFQEKRKTWVTTNRFAYANCILLRQNSSTYFSSSSSPGTLEAIYSNRKLRYKIQKYFLLKFWLKETEKKKKGTRSLFSVTISLKASTERPNRYANTPWCMQTDYECASTAMPAALRASGLGLGPRPSPAFRLCRKKPSFWFYSPQCAIQMLLSMSAMMWKNLRNPVVQYTW